jgi:hypothetical protein
MIPLPAKPFTVKAFKNKMAKTIASIEFEDIAGL